MFFWGIYSCSALLISAVVFFPLLILFDFSAAHSFILNLADKRWQKVFSEDQLGEIENDHALPLPTLPKELTEFLNKFKKRGMYNINMYIKLSRKI